MMRLYVVGFIAIWLPRLCVGQERGSPAAARAIAAAERQSRDQQLTDYAQHPEHAKAHFDGDIHQMLEAKSVDSRLDAAWDASGLVRQMRLSDIKDVDQDELAAAALKLIDDPDPRVRAAAGDLIVDTAPSVGFDRLEALATKLTKQPKSPASPKKTSLPFGARRKKPEADATPVSPPDPVREVESIFVAFTRLGDADKAGAALAKRLSDSIIAEVYWKSLLGALACCPTDKAIDAVANFKVTANDRKRDQAAADALRQMERAKFHKGDQ